MNPQPGDYRDACPEAGDLVDPAFLNCAQPPPRIGQYRLIKRLGQGGFGSVHLGYDDEVSQEVAIKWPNIARIAPLGGLNAIRSEARIAIQLRHPGIVRLYQLYSDDVVPMAIIMEYVKGQTLATRLQKRRASEEWFPHHWSLRIVAELADASAHAHADRGTKDEERGIVHCDLKPANVIVDRESPTWALLAIPLTNGSKRRILLRTRGDQRTRSRDIVANVSACCVLRRRQRLLIGLTEDNLVQLLIGQTVKLEFCRCPPRHIPPVESLHSPC